jgi:hypothetical protein
VLRREFVEVKTFKYDYKGRVVKQIKQVQEAIDDGTDEAPGEAETKENVIGFQYEPGEDEECEEDDD